MKSKYNYWLHSFSPRLFISVTLIVVMGVLSGVLQPSFTVFSQSSDSVEAYKVCYYQVEGEDTMIHCDSRTGCTFPDESFCNGEGDCRDKDGNEIARNENYAIQHQEDIDWICRDDRGNEPGEGDVCYQYVGGGFRWFKESEIPHWKYWKPVKDRLCEMNEHLGDFESRNNCYRRGQVYVWIPSGAKVGDSWKSESKEKCEGILYSPEPEIEEEEEPVVQPPSAEVETQELSKQPSPALLRRQARERAKLLEEQGVATN